MAQVFKFKKFQLDQSGCAMKIGTDGVLLGAWVDVSQKENTIDIGTGTGVIALMIAQRSNTSHIVAVEIDQDAANQATENFKNSVWDSRLSLYHGSIQSYAEQADQTFDLIVSNPPFFTGGTLSNSQDKASVRHTVKLPHGELLKSVRKLLSPDGRFAVILPDMEGYRFIEMAHTYNMHAHRIAKVFPDANKKVERLMIEFGKSSPKTIMEEDIYIREPLSEEFTKEYKALTSAFYLKF